MENLSTIHIEVADCDEAKNDSQKHACIIIDNRKSNYDWQFISRAHLSGDNYENHMKISQHSLQTVKVNADYYYQWMLVNNSENNLNSSYFERTAENITCRIKDKKLDYGGIYKILVNNGENCEFHETSGFIKLYTPLFYIFGIIFCALALVAISKMIIKTYSTRTSNSENNSVASAQKSITRIQSIDTFRGLCVLLMIFVNNGAGGYTYLNHNPWNGIFLADLVFPCFIWIMGFCIPMSIRSLKKRGFTSKLIYKKVVIRSVLLFCIGISLNSIGGNIQLENIRIFGVLQRCAIGYFVVSVTYSLMSLKDRHYKRSAFRITYDIIVLMPQWIVMVVIVAFHWYFTFYHKFADCEIGYIGPGGNSNGGSHDGCPGGAAGYIDRKLLGTNHLLQNSIVNMAFGSGPYEPEGILGCLTTIFHTFLGLQAGITLMSYKEKWKFIIFKYIIWSLFFGLSGLYLHYYLHVPINKNLWSLSFVLITSSIAFAVMSIIFILVDVLKWWEGGPFRIPGMNAFILYIGSQICYQTFPFHWKYGENMHYDRFLFLSGAVWDTGCWTVIAYIMHHNKIYINL